jgi:hypothetical protein
MEGFIAMVVGVKGEPKLPHHLLISGSLCADLVIAKERVQ